MSDLQWFFDIVRALGISGGPVFAVLWWLERSERKESQKSVTAFFGQLLTATNQMTASVVEMTKVVAESAKDTDEVLASTTQLAKVVQALGVAVRQRRLP